MKKPKRGVEVAGRQRERGSGASLAALGIVGVLSIGGIVLSALKPDSTASTWAALSPLIVTLTYAAFGWKPTK